VNLHKAIDELRAEKLRLDRMIAQLERWNGGPVRRAPRKRRTEAAPAAPSGPKPTPEPQEPGEAPVLEVSEKMVRYWRGRQDDDSVD
jgi:hypothetical protein